MRANSTVLDPSAKYLDNDATALTQKRYQRIAPLYDKIESLMERRFRPWRRRSSFALSPIPSRACAKSAE